MAGGGDDSGHEDDIGDFLRGFARDAGFVSWSRLLAALLRRGRAGHHIFTELTHARVRLLATTRDFVAAELQALLHQLGMPLFADEDSLDRLATHCQVPDSDRAADLFISHAAALAIAEVFGPAIARELRAKQTNLLRSGDLHPIWHLDLKEPVPLMPPPYSSAPQATQDLRLDRAGMWGVMAEGSTYRICLDWDAHDRLAPLAVVERLRVAVCQPCRDLDEFAVEIHSDAEGSEARSFSNAGPRADGHTEQVIRLLDRASQLGASITVFPEYTVSESQRTVVKQAVSELRSPPILVVGGSALVDLGGGQPVNQACLWLPFDQQSRLPDAAETVLLKTNPAIIDMDVEDIDTGLRTVRLFPTRRHLVAVLICRDVMSEDLRRLLVDVGVTLLIVIAMTPKSRTLVDQACQLVSSTQALVAIGNAPLRWPGVDDSVRTQAAMHAAYGEPGGPIEVPPAQRALERPGVVLFDVYGRSVEVSQDGE